MFVKFDLKILLPPILIKMCRLIVTVSDESVWRLGTGEFLTPLSCCCAVHSQLSHVLSFIKWRWSLLYWTGWDSPFNHWISFVFQKYFSLIIKNCHYVYAVWYYIYIYMTYCTRSRNQSTSPSQCKQTNSAVPCTFYRWQYLTWKMKGFEIPIHWQNVITACCHQTLCTD